MQEGIVEVGQAYRKTMPSLKKLISNMHTPLLDPYNYIVVDGTNPKAVAIIKRLHDER